MRVSVPASTANLGCGFDCLAIALALPFEASTERDDSWLIADDHHPLTVAYRQHGGENPLWWRSPIPPGRGLGFSGAARVAGVALALGERQTLGSRSVPPSREFAVEVGRLAGALEGHLENAAASALGGAVVASGDVIATVPIDPRLRRQLVLWWPDGATTSTSRSRSVLRDVIAWNDAVHNIGGAAIMVAGIASGDVDAIAAGTDDRMHQLARLDSQPATRAVMERVRLVVGASCWLSGSGPSVAAWCPASADAERLVIDAWSTLSGRVRTLPVADDGLRWW